MGYDIRKGFVGDAELLTRPAGEGTPLLLRALLLCTLPLLLLLLERKALMRLSGRGAGPPMPFSAHVSLPLPVPSRTW